jgi:phosphatidate cytidylyltransferase
MKTRVLTAVALGPLVIFAIVQGGWIFAALVLVALSISTVEWVQMTVNGNRWVAGGLASLLVWVIVVDRVMPQVEMLGPALALLLVAAMGWAVIRFREGPDRAMVGFAFTLAGGLYLGWLGAHFVALRALPDGGWWTGLAMPAVWLADVFAYLVGVMWGRTRLMPSVSPKKSVEGYLAGVVGGGLGTMGLAALWRALGAGAAFTPLHGLAIGLLAGTIGPLGDLGISALKRHVGVKDSGRLLPGHGGLLDRVDALLVAVPVGYYYVVFVALRGELGR